MSFIIIKSNISVISFKLVPVTFTCAFRRKSLSPKGMAGSVSAAAVVYVRMPEAAVVIVIVLVMCTVLKSGEVTIRYAVVYDEIFSPVVVPFWYIVIVWATPSEPSATSMTVI